MSVLFVYLALSLVLTLAIELPVAAVLGVRTVRGLSAVALVNAITNPPLVYAVTLLRLFVLPLAPPGLGVTAEWVFIAVGEALVVIVEWRLLAWALGGRSRTWLVRSAVMNAASFGFGLVLVALAPRLWGG